MHSDDDAGIRLAREDLINRLYGQLKASRTETEASVRFMSELKLWMEETKRTLLIQRAKRCELRL